MNNIKSLLFRDIFDEIPIGVEIYNEKGLLVDLNNKDMEIFGLYNKQDMMGIDLLHNPNLTDEQEQSIIENDETSLHFKYYFEKTKGYYPSYKDGFIYLCTKIRKVYDNQGSLIGYIMINLDESKQKLGEIKLIEAKERAETADKLKSAFLANMSHEIRTPLNAIIGFSNLMVETKEQEERNQYKDIIEQNNNHLLKLIANTLDIAQIESDTIKFDIRSTDPTQLCKDIIAGIQLKKQDNILLEFDKDSPECMIMTDQTRIQQVLRNLVDNAIKFSPQGTIRLGYNYTEDMKIRFYVSDNGIGIPKEKHEEIFERFVKLDDFSPGTGLGLSISKSIIEQLNGTIGVESEPKQGSTFWFILPIA